MFQSIGPANQVDVFVFWRDELFIRYLVCSLGPIKLDDRVSGIEYIRYDALRNHEVNLKSSCTVRRGRSPEPVPFTGSDLCHSPEGSGAMAFKNRGATLFDY